MQNPFDQFLPDEELPKDEIQDEVMGNIHMKSYLINILELFTAIFGITLTDSIPYSAETNKPPKNSSDNS